MQIHTYQQFFIIGRTVKHSERNLCLVTMKAGTENTMENYKKKRIVGEGNER